MEKSQHTPSLSPSLIGTLGQVEVMPNGFPSFMVVVEVVSLYISVRLLVAGEGICPSSRIFGRQFVPPKTESEKTKPE